MPKHCKNEISFKACRNYFLGVLLKILSSDKILTNIYPHSIGPCKGEGRSPNMVRIDISSMPDKLLKFKKFKYFLWTLKWFCIPKNKNTKFK